MPPQDRWMLEQGILEIAQPSRESDASRVSPRMVDFVVCHRIWPRGFLPGMR